MKTHTNTGTDPLRFDRRAHPRLPVLRPARLVRDEQSVGGLTFARTMDVSVGGALIEIAASRPFNAGEAVRVAILGDSVVIDPRTMAEAVIVRVELAGPGRQRVAVKFDRERALPAAA